MANLVGLETLLHCKGFVTSFLIKDIVLIVLGVFLLKNIIIPKINAYRLGKKLDSIAKGPKAHWFYGHLFTFGKSFAKSALPRSRIPTSYPVMFNEWKGPWNAGLTLHHQDSAQAYFASKAPKDEFVYFVFRPWLGDPLALSSGKKWKRSRRLLTPMFHSNILKEYNDVFNKSFRKLIKRWETMTEKSVDVLEEINVVTLDNIVQCAMSPSDKLDAESAKDAEIYKKEFRNVLSIIIQRFDNPLHLIDWIFNITTLGRSFHKSVKALHNYTNQLITARQNEIKKIKMASDKNETQQEPIIHRSGKYLDFLDILLQTRDEDGKGLSEEEVRNQVDSMLFGGHDTTSSGISWTLYNLAKFPHLQNKCRKEINEVVGDKDNVEWNDLRKFDYLAMFIKESMRLYPPVVLISKRLDKPLTIESKLHKPEKVVIPEGTPLSLNIMALHRNQHMWENPEVFDPERFSPENSSKRHPYAFIPFSAGSRNCIAKTFAMNEMTVGLAQIIRCFELSLDDDAPPPDLEYRVTLQSSNGIHVKLKKINANT